ncbi:hypothetical protein M899_0296 [Bacteriovorax sp. BSW11_IV]|uniref:hypothetical protein n=1 Tax=Bacteriovorax sp. BSW11_IV TaxID=1353529 RepID=UPI00038A3475|nr:hypothetical protein [Bacteriovorax sp. BSW11_IV]EQC50279.1 hypothetical protein M899_0296 [Bacteriovorax sp. BSW11_IV]
MKSTFFALMAFIQISSFALDLNPNLKLIARASDGGSYGVPDISYFQDVSPSLNDHDEIAARILSVEDSVISGIFIFSDNKITIPYVAPSELSVSDVHLNNKGLISFYLLGDGFAEGLYRYQKSTSSVAKLMDAFEHKLLGISDAYSDDEGYTYARILDKDNQRELVKFSNISNESQPLLSEKEGVISYLFTPIISRSGKYVVKARLGHTGDWAESRPDVLFSNVNNKNIIRYYDNDYHSNAPVKGFRNSAAINNKGDIAYVALGFDGRYGVFFNDNEYIREGELDISSIDYFAPRVNNKEEVLFRYTNHEGAKVIAIATKMGVRVVAKTGDLVTTDVKTAQITGFHGTPDLNNNSKVAFVATLYDKDKNEYLGHGLFLAE